MISVVHYCSGTTDKINAELFFKKQNKIKHISKQKQSFHVTSYKSYHDPRQILLNVKKYSNFLPENNFYFCRQLIIYSMSISPGVLIKQLLYATVLDSGH